MVENNSIAVVQPAGTMPATMIKCTDLFFLDGLRGIAAAVVMIGHARWLLWEGYSEGYLKHPDRYSFFEKTFVYFLSAFRYGHQAVLFFFVLSGFVIHLKYSAGLKKDPQLVFDLRAYLFRRVKRIYPPLLFVLLFTWLLDIFGESMGYSIYFRQTPNALINANVGNDHSLINLAGNFFLLQNDKIGTWGSNGPLWSLKYEWWFYIIYPFMFIINRRSVYAAMLLVPVLFVTSFFIHVHAFVFAVSVFQYLLCWWLGCILSDIYTKRITVKYSLLAVATLVIPLLVLFENRINSMLLSDVGWAFGFFGLLNFLFFLRQKGGALDWLNKLKWLGDCSFTLYIIHFPVLVLLNGLLLHFTGNTMPGTTLFVPAGVIICTTLAWGFHFITEEPFTRKKIRIAD